MSNANAANDDHSPGYRDRRPLALLIFAFLILSVAALRGFDFFHSTPSPPGGSPRLVWLEGGTAHGLYRVAPDTTLADLQRVSGLSIPAGPAVYQTVPLPRQGPVTALRLAAGQEPEELPRLPAHLAPLFFQPIPINQADAELLAFLPGIGPKLAARIIAAREERGGSFASLAELDAVKGIGPAKLKTITEQVVVE